MSGKAKILRGVTANLYAQGVTIGTQLGTLPIALSIWGLDTYGRWILLTAIPAYLGLAELGMGMAATTLAIQASAQQEHAKAQAYLSTANFLGLITCCVVLTLTAITASILKTTLLLSGEEAISFTLVAAATLVAVQMSIQEAAFRATNRYALGTLLTTSARLLEWIGFISGLIINGSFLGVAVGMITARLMALAIQILILYKPVNTLSFAVRLEGAAFVKRLLKPAIQVSLFPIVNLLTVQGITIVVGTFYGAVAAGVYSAYRTYARIVLQAVTIVSNPVQNLVTELMAGKEYRRALEVYRRALQYAIYISLMLPAALLYGSEQAFQYWTHGKVAVQYPIMVIMLASASAAAMLSIPRALLIASGRPGAASRTIVGIACVQLSVAVLIAFNFSLIATLSVVLAMDVLMTAVLMLAARKLKISNSFS